MGQYKNARRVRAHRKMKSIIREADRIEWELCETELAAFLLEARLIQEHRPRWNTEGAFSFLYPMIGIVRLGSQTYFCLTTLPEEFIDFSLHGAYRSRGITREAFFAWMRLLGYVGHPVAKKDLSVWSGKKYSYVYGFRQIPENWSDLWDQFLKGESFAALEELSLSLVENAAARARADLIQEDLNWLKHFWRHEALRLKKARTAVSYSDYPVPQKYRDFLFIEYRQSFRK